MSVFFKKALTFLGSFAWDTLLPAIILLVAGILVIRILMRIVTSALERSKTEPTARKLIRSLLRVVLYCLLFLIIASRLGVDVTGVVALASVLTLAISLSVQSALTNVISGLTLLNTKPFVAGDYVEVAGQAGTVKEVGLTYTKLATPDNKIVSIPNSAVTATEIVNYTVSGTRRVAIEISTSFDTPVDVVLESLLQAGQVPTRLEEKEPFAAISGYKDGTTQFILHVWCNGPDYWTTLFQINKNIKAIFDEKNIRVTCPNIFVHTDK